MANLMRDLQRSWRQDGATVEARTALARWAARHPELSAHASPAQLVEASYSRSDPLARCLIEDLAEDTAADRWAVLVLQAILPGLARLVRHHRDLVGARQPFATIDDLDQFVVCTALERIPEIARDTAAFRLRSALDGVWTRLRSHAAAHHRERGVDAKATAELEGGACTAERVSPDTQPAQLRTSVTRTLRRSRCRLARRPSARRRKPGQWSSRRD